MTTTSVKDVSAVMSAMAANMANSASGVAQTNFQSVFSQTNKNTVAEDAKKQTARTKSTDPREEVLKAKETVRKPVKENKAEENKAKSLSDEQNEEAMEVLGTAANEMLQQVADTFGMSVEELKQLMDDMNMSLMDLMNPEQLSALLLKAAGLDDPMALLTNEQLYADFKQLMSKQQELLAQLKEDLQMSDEQLTQLLGEEDGTETLQEPQITVDVAEGATAQKADKGADTKGGEQNLSGEQSGNLFMQNLKNEMLQPEVNSVESGSVWDADTQNIMRQIMDYLKIQIKPGVSDLEMQLHPENLGTLQIHLSAKGGMITANFVTQNETVKAALESQMIQLKENFAEQGVKVEAIEVTVQTHQFERNLNQGRGSAQGEAEKKSRPRRINLNALSGLENSEEMTQEETLAAEMMTVNGNTVDYTA